jgi:tetratricopeptide (TPR) repeat protein
MIIHWISLGAVIVSLVIIAVIVIRKLSRLAIIDVETILGEKESRVKEKLIWQRIARKSRERGAPIVKLGQNFKKRTIDFFERLHQSAKHLEKKYTTEKRIAKPVRIKSGGEEKIKLLLEDAKRLADEEKFSEAEAKYIEIVGLDHRHGQAYRALADIYLKTKQFDQAKETLDFIIKLRQDDDKTYAMHGEVAYLEGDYGEAKEYFLIALARDPKFINYYLDLAKVYTALSNHEEARDMLVKAQELEPKNPKILDFLVENSIMLGNQDSAEKFYEEFMALSPDNPKLEIWKAKIAEMK